MNLDYASSSLPEITDGDIKNIVFDVVFLASDNGYGVEMSKIANLPISG